MNPNGGPLSCPIYSCLDKYKVTPRKPQVEYTVSSFNVLLHCKCVEGFTGSLQGNQSAGISKLQGLQVFMQSPIVFHLRYACRYCIKKYVYLTCYLLRIHMKFPQILQGYSHKLCYYMVSPQLVQDFPTYNVGHPHSIPVQQIPFKYYNGNQSVEISKLQGLQVYMQSP